jgi:hypothetical protein
LAHAQHLPSIESLSESYVACVQSAFMRRLDDFGASNLPQATEQAFLDCQLEEDALYTTAAASAPGTQRRGACGIGFAARTKIISWAWAASTRGIIMKSSPGDF